MTRYAVAQFQCIRSTLMPERFYSAKFRNRSILAVNPYPPILFLVSGPNLRPEAL